MKLTPARRLSSLVAAFAVLAAVLVPAGTDAAQARGTSFAVTVSDTIGGLGAWIDADFEIPHAGSYFEASVQAPAGSGPFTSIAGMNSMPGVGSRFTSDGRIEMWGTVPSVGTYTFSDSLRRADGKSVTISFTGTVLPALAASSVAITTVTASADALVLRATVSPSTATGTVRFRGSGGFDYLGPAVPVVNGVATFSGSLPSYYIGSSLSVTAYYAGDGPHSNAVSAAAVLPIYKSDTVSGIVSENGVGTAGAAVALTSPSGTVVQSTTADGSGRYSFTVPVGSSAQISTQYLIRATVAGSQWYYTGGTPATNLGSAATASATTFTSAHNIAVNVAPIWTDTTLEAPHVGSAYSDFLVASAVGGVTYSMQSVATYPLPTGLSLNGATGEISGTTTGPVGNYWVIFQATSAGGASVGRSMYFSVVPAYNDPVWADSTLATARAGESYADGVTATGDATISYNSTGTLPPGLTLDGETGELTGTPTTAGLYTFTITASNSHASVSQLYADFSVADALADVAWVESSLGAFQVGETYNDAVTASGNPVPEYSYTGTLPPGIQLNETTGAVTGEPTQTGTYTFTISASSSRNSVERTFTRTVTAAFVGPTWVDDELEDFFFVGTEYESAVSATGSPSVTYSVTGTLPAGLSLDPDTGILSGTPTTVGDVAFTIHASNGRDEVTADYEFTVFRAFEAPVWVESALADTMQAGEPYSDSVEASGWIDPVYAGFDLPPGLQVDPETGAVTGTPTTPGHYEFTIAAANYAGFVQADYDLTVIAAFSGPTWTDAAISTSMRAGVAYTDAVAATGAPGVAYDHTGTLPPGLTLDASTGALTGTPTTPGAYAFDLRASNGRDVVTASFAVVVDPAYVTPTFTDDEIADPQQTIAFADAVAALGDGTIDYEVVAGALPAGLALDPATGAIVGTTTSTGAYSFTVRARSVHGYSDAVVGGTIVAAPSYSVSPRFAAGQTAAGAQLELGAERVGSAGAWTATMFSTPVVIGAGAASAGSIAATVSLPSSVAAGAHRVEFAVTVADGSTRTTTVWFTVLRNGTIGAVSLLGPLAYYEGSLAAAGLDSSVAFSAAVLLFASGLVLLRRRRLVRA